jgi:hypothetical protein
MLGEMADSRSMTGSTSSYQKLKKPWETTGAVEKDLEVNVMRFPMDQDKAIWTSRGIIHAWIEIHQKCKANGIMMIC